MKTINFRSPIIMLAIIALITGCKDSNKNAAPTFTGNYAINSAMLSEALVVPTNEAGNITLPAGTDITQLIQSSLLSAVNCSSAANSLVELRKDYSLYLSCSGSNALNAGTWESVSSTTLTLNLNSTAIPTSPTGFVLAVTDIVDNTTSITGTTSVPIPKAMIAQMISALSITLSPTAPEVFTIKFSVQFSKK